MIQMMTVVDGIDQIETAETWPTIDAALWDVYNAATDEYYSAFYKWIHDEDMEPLEIDNSLWGEGHPKVIDRWEYVNGED